MCIHYLGDDVDQGQDLWSAMMRNPSVLRCYRFHEDAKLPIRTSDGAAGFNLFLLDDAVLAPPREKADINRLESRRNFMTISAPAQA